MDNPTQVKDFSAAQFAAKLRMQCRENDGEVTLGYQGLTDDSMVQLAEGLEMVCMGSPRENLDDDDEGDDDCPTRLYLYCNDLGNAGLGALAEVFSRLPRCRETLEELSIAGNGKVTTLEPLADAGVLEGLTQLWASSCSLSGEGVLPPELCANLPALEELHLNNNSAHATVTLTADALCALPAECQVVLNDSKVQVACPTAKDGEMGLVALPTAEGEEFGALFASGGKTVAEICAFAGVQRATLVKPARAAALSSSSSSSMLMQPPTTEDVVLTDVQLDELGKFANELADAAGEEIRPRFRSTQVLAKGNTSAAGGGAPTDGYNDCVTAADIEGERTIRRLIEERYPGHAIIGEELGVRGKPDEAEFCWILDPVDGTRDFATGTLTWGTLISLCHHKCPIIGVIDQPVTRERWIGIVGRPTIFRAREDKDFAEVRTAQCASLSDARANLSGSGIACLRDRKFTQGCFKMVDVCLTASFGGPDAYTWGLLASGCVDVVLDAPDSGLVDVAAVVPIIVGAGGAVRGHDGSVFSPSSPVPGGLDPEAAFAAVAFGDVQLVDETLAILNSPIEWDAEN